MVKIFRFSYFQISVLFWDLPPNILRAAASCSETLVPVYQTTWCNFSEDWKLF